MRRFILVALLLTATGSAALAQLPWSSSPTGATAYPLKVDNGQLRTYSGTPFFIVGNAAYELMNYNTLSGTGSSSMTYYFYHRQAGGTNAAIVQAICDAYLLCPNTGATQDGTLPFTSSLAACTPANSIPCWDISTPNTAYWNEVVAMVNLAAQYGILIELGTINSGGCISTGQFQMLANNGATKAYNFGVFLGNTFKNISNIIWYHGQDYTCWQNSTDDNLVLQVAQGIQSTGDTHLHTMEVAYPTPGTAGPGGANQTSLDDTTHNWASVIGLNWVYQQMTTYTLSLHAYNQAPSVPAFLGEYAYAGGGGNADYGSVPGCSSSTDLDIRTFVDSVDHGWRVLRLIERWLKASILESGRWEPVEVGPAQGSAIGNPPYCPVRQRQQEWWAATMGAYWGANTGNDANPIVAIPTLPDTQYLYLANFMRRIPWWKLQPSPGGPSSIVTAGYGSNADRMTLSSNYVTSSLASDGTLAVIYIPNGVTGAITVNMALIGSSPTAQWYDPTADSTQAGSYTTICSPTTTPCGAGSVNFTSPFTHANDNTTDAVLLITR
jgi:hypothetical protein